jgi:hypothetical protein
MRGSTEEDACDLWYPCRRGSLCDDARSSFDRRLTWRFAVASFRSVTRRLSQGLKKALSDKATQGQAQVSEL